MKMRSIWNGQLKLSLVQVSVRAYSALDHSVEIQFNQLHQNCHQRVKQKLCCPIHGELQRDQIVKGYEFQKDQYVVLSQADFDQVELTTTRTIEIVQFIQPAELDPVYLDAPYYLGPNGPAALDAYCVIQQAIQRSGKIGVGRVVLNGKERLVALSAIGKGLRFTTLRLPDELRSPEALFADIPSSNQDPEQIDLAERLIVQKSRPLDLSTFNDRYRTGLLGLIKAKIAGSAPLKAVPETGTTQVSNIMDALRLSLAESKSSIVNGAERPSIAA